MFWSALFHGGMSSKRSIHSAHGTLKEYPVSMGHVHIKSGDDPHAAPDFEVGYLRE
jgi:alcohol oxidase